MSSNSKKEVGRDVLAVFKDNLSIESLEKLKEGLREKIAEFKRIRELPRDQRLSLKAKEAAKEFLLTKDMVGVSKKHQVSVARIMDALESIKNDEQL